MLLNANIKYPPTHWSSGTAPTLSVSFSFVGFVWDVNILGKGVFVSTVPSSNWNVNDKTHVNA